MDKIIIWDFRNVVLEQRTDFTNGVYLPGDHYGGGAYVAPKSASNARYGKGISLGIGRDHYRSSGNRRDQLDIRERQ